MIARPRTTLMLLLALYSTVHGQQQSMSSTQDATSTRLRGVASVFAPPQEGKHQEGSSSLNEEDSFTANTTGQRQLEESCDCDYHMTGFARGGCRITKKAPPGKACFCLYKGLWTCHGVVEDCNDKDDEKCKDPDTGKEYCLMAPQGHTWDHTNMYSERDCGGY